MATHSFGFDLRIESWAVAGSVLNLTVLIFEFSYVSTVCKNAHIANGLTSRSGTEQENLFRAKFSQIIVRNPMFRKSIVSASIFGVVAVSCVIFAGCRQSGSCRSGSCGAPSAGYSSSNYSSSPSYSEPAYQGSSQGYSSPGGSGTRSAPMNGGSGTR